MERTYDDTAELDNGSTLDDCSTMCEHPSFHLVFPSPPDLTNICTGNIPCGNKCSSNIPSGSPSAASPTTDTINDASICTTETREEAEQLNGKDKEQQPETNSFPISKMFATTETFVGSIFVCTGTGTSGNNNGVVDDCAKPITTDKTNNTHTSFSPTSSSVGSRVSKSTNPDAFMMRDNHSAVVLSHMPSRNVNAKKSNTETTMHPQSQCNRSGSSSSMYFQDHSTSEFPITGTNTDLDYDCPSHVHYHCNDNDFQATRTSTKDDTIIKYTHRKDHDNVKRETRDEKELLKTALSSAAKSNKSTATEKARNVHLQLHPSPNTLLLQNRRNNCIKLDDDEESSVFTGCFLSSSLSTEYNNSNNKESPLQKNPLEIKQVPSSLPPLKFKCSKSSSRQQQQQQTEPESILLSKTESLTMKMVSELIMNQSPTEVDMVVTDEIENTSNFEDDCVGEDDDEMTGPMPLLSDNCDSSLLESTHVKVRSSVNSEPKKSHHKHPRHYHKKKDDIHQFKKELLMNKEKLNAILYELDVLKGKPKREDTKAKAMEKRLQEWRRNYKPLLADVERNISRSSESATTVESTTMSSKEGVTSTNASASMFVAIIVLIVTIFALLIVCYYSHSSKNNDYGVPIAVTSFTACRNLLTRTALTMNAWVENKTFYDIHDALLYAVLLMV